MTLSRKKYMIILRRWLLSLSFVLREKNRIFVKCMFFFSRCYFCFGPIRYGSENTVKYIEKKNKWAATTKTKKQKKRKGMSGKRYECMKKKENVCNLHTSNVAHFERICSSSLSLNHIITEYSCIVFFFRSLSLSL